MSIGNGYPVHSSVPNSTITRGCWTGGGAAANCTKAAADWSRNVKSVAYNAATGKYLITLYSGGQQIVGGSIESCGAAGVAKKFPHLIRSSYTAPTAASPFPTVQMEVWTAAGALVDLATTDVIMIELWTVSNKP